MGITVGAALKKLAASALTNKKVLKVVGGLALGILLLLFLPVMAILALLNSDIQFHEDAFRQYLEENMTPEQVERLRIMHSVTESIRSAMIQAGFENRVQEAEILYTLALSEFAADPDMPVRLAACFEENQTDAQLVQTVNAFFGTDISAEEFSGIMDGLRGVSIDTSRYTDPATKNNLDLTQWALAAERARWGYVWGSFGEVLSRSALDARIGQYPEEVGGQADFIEAHWLGRRTADCVGLIKGYGWLNTETIEIVYGTNGMPDIGADDMYTNATEKGTIDTIPEIPGLAVWKEGHIGIYIGGGEVIEAMGTRYGVVRTQLVDRPWTHWLKIPYIKYIDESLPVDPTEGRDGT